MKCVVETRDADHAEALHQGLKQRYSRVLWGSALSYWHQASYYQFCYLWWSCEADTSGVFCPLYRTKLSMIKIDDVWYRNRWCFVAIWGSICDDLLMNESCAYFCNITVKQIQSLSWMGIDWNRNVNNVKQKSYNLY